MTKVKTKEDALLDELLGYHADPKQTLWENGLLKQLQKKLVERPGGSPRVGRNNRRALRRMPIVTIH